MIFLKRRAFMTFKFNYETSKGIKQVILTNCGQAPFKRFSILGNSHQDSTTGKQLFKLTDNYLHAYFYHGENKKIVPYSSNAVVYLPCEPNTTYTIHGRKNINNDMTRKNRVGLTSELPAFNVKITKTAETTLDKPLTITTEEDTKYLVIMAITDGEIGQLNFDKVLENNTSKLMVEVGDKASPYEPYTGGKPSPSPDYLQEIKSVGKWNEKTQKYEVDVRVTGKNLFNIDSFLKLPLQPVSGNDSVRKLILTLKPNTKYTLSTNNEGTCNSQDKDTSRSLYFTNVDDEIYQCDTTAVFKGKKVTVTSDENGRVKIVLFDRTNSKPIENKQCYVMLNEGTFAEPYEPYFPEQTATITMDEPLRGIGKYQDKITKDGIVRWIKEIVLDDSSGWTTDNSNQNVGIINRFLHRINDMRNVYYEKVTVCDKFRWIGMPASESEAGSYRHTTHGTKFYICLLKKDYPDVESLKQFLSKNPVTVQYALHNPVTEPLTQEQKSALESLCTSPGTTVITVDGGDVDAGIEVEYATKNKE